MKGGRADLRRDDRVSHNACGLMRDWATRVSG